jgi:uncharacterized membrane protein (DUF485 family)
LRAAVGSGAAGRVVAEARSGPVVEAGRVVAGGGSAARRRSSSTASGWTVASRSSGQMMVISSLVKARWTVSFILLALLFVSYYGYILLVATRPAIVARHLTDAPDAVANIGLALGIGTLVFAWILTAIYVVWANRAYDSEVERLKAQLKR